MIPEQKKVMLRYTTLVLFFALMSVCIIVKAGLIMFAERQYWKDVADRFVKENVAIPPTRGNIISADGKLMASSLPEYKIYMDFKADDCFVLFHAFLPPFSGAGKAPLTAS